MGNGVDLRQMARDVGVERRERPRVYKKIVGQQTGKGFVEFLIHLFLGNEVWKMTDPTLKKMILVEFGHVDKTVSSFTKGNQSIGKLRIEFNSGVYMPQVWPVEKPGHPPVLSLKYNLVDGKYVPVRNRSVNKTMTNGELRELLFRYPKVQETPEALFRRLGRNIAYWDKDSSTV